ncbi:hypothetical protein CC2G_010931 [Coprinopsis cinerea AmutBmut pab1-1]|nr:hypothetical protein CC2G_010931 [Coprinopsis cinerea AmutBmut pab1-1]
MSSLQATAPSTSSSASMVLTGTVLAVMQGLGPILATGLDGGIPLIACAFIVLVIVSPWDWTHALDCLEETIQTSGVRGLKLTISIKSTAGSISPEVGTRLTSLLLSTQRWREVNFKFDLANKPHLWLIEFIKQAVPEPQDGSESYPPSPFARVLSFSLVTHDWTASNFNIDPSDWPLHRLLPNVQNLVFNWAGIITKHEFGPSFIANLPLGHLRRLVLCASFANDDDYPRFLLWILRGAKELEDLRMETDGPYVPSSVDADHVVGTEVRNHEKLQKLRVKEPTDYTANNLAGLSCPELRSLTVEYTSKFESPPSGDVDGHWSAVTRNVIAFLQGSQLLHHLSLRETNFSDDDFIDLLSNTPESLTSLELVLLANRRCSRDLFRTLRVSPKAAAGLTQLVVSVLGVPCRHNQGLFKMNFDLFLNLPVAKRKTLEKVALSFDRGATYLETQRGFTDEEVKGLEL